MNKLKISRSAATIASLPTVCSSKNAVVSPCGSRVAIVDSVASRSSSHAVMVQHGHEDTNSRATTASTATGCSSRNAVTEQYGNCCDINTRLTIVASTTGHSSIRAVMDQNDNIVTNSRAAIASFATGRSSIHTVTEQHGNSVTISRTSIASSATGSYRSHAVTGQNGNSATISRTAIASSVTGSYSSHVVSNNIVNSRDRNKSTNELSTQGGCGSSENNDLRNNHNSTSTSNNSAARESRSNNGVDDNNNFRVANNPGSGTGESSRDVRSTSTADKSYVYLTICQLYFLAQIRIHPLFFPSPNGSKMMYCHDSKTCSGMLTADTDQLDQILNCHCQTSELNLI